MNVMVQGLPRSFKSANTKSLSLSPSLFRILHPHIRLHLHHLTVLLCPQSPCSVGNSAADLLSFIDSKRKGLYTEDHTLEPFANDELKYFQEAQERVQALHEELQKASSKLTIILRNLTRKPSISYGENFGSTIVKKKKENKRKVKKK